MWIIFLDFFISENQRPFQKTYNNSSNLIQSTELSPLKFFWFEIQSTELSPLKKFWFENTCNQSNN